MKQHTHVPGKIKVYCRMIHQATKLGVSLEDILHETQKYHGEHFTEEVRKSLTSI